MIKTSNFLLGGFLSLTLVSGVILASSKTSAEDVKVSDVSIAVPASCEMSGSGMSSHTADVDNGTYREEIGKTTITVFCNDGGGYAIYAAGYTGDEIGGTNSTKLVGVDTNLTIDTGVYTQGTTTTSVWAMKLNKVTDTSVSYTPANLTIENGFNSYHIVPSSYTKVASFSSTTDLTLGSKLETTYAAFVSGTQRADTYNGKVKYTLVHPANEIPAQPQTATSGCINYFANSSTAVGTMGCQYIGASATSATLIASNFSRAGYGFAGWSDIYDYATNPNAHFYGPQEEITFTAGQYTSPNNGLALYAVWVPSVGTFQDSSKVTELCGTGANSLTQAPIDGTANLSSVSALTDIRDNQTYAIAKLADGKCWMIESLRIEAENTRSDNDEALAQGYSKSTIYGNFEGLANAENVSSYPNSYSANSLYYSGTQEGTASIDIGTTDGQIFRMPRYNNWNNQTTSANRPQNPTGNNSVNNDTNAGLFSYGNGYTWAAAMANTIFYSSPTFTDANGKTSETVNTSLCPTGWRIPYGRYTDNGAAGGGFAFLDERLGGNGTDSDSNTTPTGEAMSKAWRSFPNNFLRSGGGTLYRGNIGYYWTSTVSNYGGSYILYLGGAGVNPGEYNYNRYNSAMVRCVIDS